jgi:predicted ATPase
VREHLRDKSVLLILDNCEHLVAAASAVARAILETCPGAHILATSRVALGVIGEAIYRLKPLDQKDAIQLFGQRAEAASPGFRVDGANAESIAEICRRLDGVPLAIELVVPRLRVQSASELAIAVLDAAWQTHSHERHGSLHALAEWSYRLITPDQQMLFRRVGVFAGWFDADDAAALLTDDAMHAPALLSALVEQSMLVREQILSGARYRLLEILRVFAREKLAEAGDFEIARQRHTERIFWLVERVDFLLEGRAAESRQKVTTMIDDIRSALAMLLETEPQQAAWLCAAMYETWTENGRASEGLRWSELAIDASPDPSPQRAWILYTHALLLAELGREDEGRAWLAKAAALAGQPQKANLNVAFALVRARAHQALGDPDTARLVRHDAIQELSRNGDDVTLSRALNYEAMALLTQGRVAEARDIAKHSIDLRRRVDPSRLGRSLDTLAQAYVFLGELEQARQCWLEALEHSDDLGWGRSSAWPVYFFGIALLAGLDGNKEVSLRLHYWAERLRAETGSVYNEPIAPKQKEVISRLEAEAGPDAVAILRAEAAALTPEEALQLAKAEI